jgi:hypothetical protein
MVIVIFIDFVRNRCKIDISIHIATNVYFLVIALKIED